MRTRRPCRAPVARSAFAGCCFPPDVIVLAVRWYLRFGLSYRDVEELLAERGVHVDHVTVDRWVQRFTPLLAMATAEEVVGTDHGEAHRVLVAISHSAGGAFPDDEQAGMGRGVPRTVARVDPATTKAAPGADAIRQTAAGRGLSRRFDACATAPAHLNVRRLLICPITDPGGRVLNSPMRPHVDQAGDLLVLVVVRQVAAPCRRDERVRNGWRGADYRAPAGSARVATA